MGLFDKLKKMFSAAPSVPAASPQPWGEGEIEHLKAADQKFAEIAQAPLNEILDPVKTVSLRDEFLQELRDLTSRRLRTGGDHGGPGILEDLKKGMPSREAPKT